MATITSLPVIDVYIAFNPTYSGTTLTTANTQALPASGASNAYWTNVSKYLRDFDTNEGKQHFLERVESGTLRMTVYGRDGYFVNGAKNGTGYVIQSRQPIAVTATWGATTYPVFWGITDSVQEQVTDYLNVDFIINASDLLKQLSLKYLSSTSFWETYAQSASAANWYRCTTTNTAVVTAATGNGTTITYTAFHNFSSGQNITITGLTIGSGASLNLTNVTIASVSSTGFTVTNSTVGVSSGTGAAYRTAVLDQIGSNNGNFMGVVSFPTYGAMIYDSDGCVDIANGSKKVTGYVRLPNFVGTQGGIDFWVLGQNLSNALLTLVWVSGGSVPLFLQTDSQGHIGVNNTTSSVYADGAGGRPNIRVNDGYWHHVGLISDSSGYLHLYADGQFISISSVGTYTGWTSGGTNTTVGSLGPGVSLQVDEIIISNTSSLSTLDNEVRSRWRAGSLLQLPTNPSQSQVLSGDRIAEVLCLAGFGSIVNGALTLNANTYFINEGSAWVEGTSTNGFIHVEPYYWDTPVTGSTALDLIGQITDSDVGVFFAKADGTFAFYNQNFYGSWAWSGTSGTWTPNSYTPSGPNVWTDDDSGYAYDGPSLQVLRDDADTWEQVKITPQAGVEQIYENTAGEGRWGYSTLLKASTVHPTLNLALSTANFLGYLFRSPLPRVQTVELHSTTVQGGTVGGQMAAILGVNNGDVVAFKRSSPGASTSGSYPDVKGQINQNMVVEAKQLSFKSEPGTLVARFTLDPYPVRS